MVEVVFGDWILLILIILILLIVVLGLISIMVHLVVIILIIRIIIVILVCLVIVIHLVFYHVSIGNHGLPLKNFFWVGGVEVICVLELLLILIVFFRLLLVNGLDEIFFALNEPFPVFCVGVSFVFL